MKLTSPAVAFLALAALIACLYVWLQLSEAEQPSQSATAPAAVIAESAGATTGAVPEIEAPAPSLDASVGNAVREETPRKRLLDVETVRVRGKVGLPAGVPDDERLEVLVFARGADAQRRAQDTPEHELDSLEHLVARAPVDRQGQFEVDAPLAGEAWIALRGRYCFASTAVQLEQQRASGEIRIEAALGAWVAGHVTLPDDATDSQRELAKCDFTLQFDTLRMTGANRAAGADRLREYVTRPNSALEFEFRGVDSKTDYDLRVRPDQLAAHKSQRFGVTAGVRTALEIALAHGSQLAGVVVDESGQPVADAELIARIDPEVFGQGGYRVRTTKSDADGKFALEHVPSGRLLLRISASGFLETDASLDVAERATINELRYELRRGASIAGSLKWSDGRSAPDVEVLVGFDASALGGMGAFNAWQGAEGKSTTDEQGNFVVTGLGKGPFTVRALATSDGKTAKREDLDAWIARADHVAPGSTELQLVLRAPIGVSGRVLDKRGEPLTSFKVSAREQTGGPIPGLGGERREKSVSDSADGSFQVSGLAPGAWLVDVVAEGYPRSAAVEVQLTAEGVPAPLEFVLQRGGAISGVVKDPQGVAVANAEITLKLSMAEVLRNVRIDAENSSAIPTARSDAQGRFRLSGLEAGERLIIARRHDFAESEPFSAAIEPESEVSEVELVLRRGGRILGKVFDTKGEPSVGATLQIQFGGDPMLQQFAKSDARGEFIVAHLAAGDWNVIHLPGQSDAPTSADPGADVMSMLSDMQMASVRVVDGEDALVTLGAPPKDPVELFGEVRQGSTPVAGAFITVLTDGGAGGAPGGGAMEGMKFVRSDASGQYRTQLRAAGRYLLNVQKLGAASEQQTISRSIVVPQAPQHRHDIDLPGGGIRGRVLDPEGAPVAKTRVTLFVDGPMTNTSMFGEHYSEVSTDSDGRYALDWLSPGKYTVAVGGAPFGGMFGAGSATSGRQLRDGIVVRESEVLEGIDFRLRKPGRIAGLVRTADGAPAKDATIFLRDERGRSLERFSMVVTDAAGRFTYEGLEPGAYTVVARTASEASTDSAPVRVRDGEVGDVSLSLAPGTMLLVSLSNDAGELLECSVEVLDEHGQQVNGMVSMSAVMEAFQKGLFSSREQRIGPLSPGRYRVIVRNGDGQSVSKPVTLTGQPERKLNVRL